MLDYSPNDTESSALLSAVRDLPFTFDKLAVGYATQSLASLNIIKGVNAEGVIYLNKVPQTNPVIGLLNSMFRYIDPDFDGQLVFRYSSVNRLEAGIRGNLVLNLGGMVLIRLQKFFISSTKQLGIQVLFEVPALRC